MKVFRDFEGTETIKNAVVTTGSFDGVHLGHKVIINNLINSTKEIGGESVLVTFYPHPRKVLYPDTIGKNLMLINSQKEKIELLKKTGLDNLIIVTFTIEFSKMSSVDFIRKILVGKLNARKIIIGFNHHFGHNREGDFEHLKQLSSYHNFIVEEIPEQDIQNESVSSTKIRKALLEGNIQRANAYLDHQYIIIGKINKSVDKWHKYGFKVYSIEVEEECKLIPPCGIYAVHLNINSTNIKGMAIINNTLNSSQKSVNFHLFNDIPSIIGNEGTLYFHKLIRFIDCNIENNDWNSIFYADKEKIEELIY